MIVILYSQMSEKSLLLRHYMRSLTILYTFIANPNTIEDKRYVALCLVYKMVNSMEKGLFRYQAFSLLNELYPNAVDYPFTYSLYHIVHQLVC